MQGVDPGHLAQHPTPESRLANERNVLRAVTHVEAAEKILVFGGSRVPRAVVFKVLQVGLNHGVHVTHLRHEQVFPLHHAIEYVVERNRGPGQSIRRSRCNRRCLRPVRSRLRRGTGDGTSCASTSNTPNKRRKTNTEPEPTIRIRTFWRLITPTEK